MRSILEGILIIIFLAAVAYFSGREMKMLADYLEEIKDEQDTGSK